MYTTPNNPWYFTIRLYVHLTFLEHLNFNTMAQREEFEDTKGVIRITKSTIERQYNGPERAEFQDTKGVIRNCNLNKDRQPNGQRQKDKMTNNDSTKHYTEN
jgi:hypothetical protein